MKDRVQELASVLRRQAAPFLAAHPTLQHRWLDQGAIMTLQFPPTGDSGFEVALQVGNGYAYVLAGHSHHAFHPPSDSPDSEIARALDLVRDLLSPRMRLSEVSSGGRPYRWVVERQLNGQWRPHTEDSSVFFNYFGRRSERVFQNTQLQPQ